MPIRSQEPLLRLPRGCSFPKLWAVLACFPRPQAGSWKGSGAAAIRTGAHMGSRACKARTFNHLCHRAGRPQGLLYGAGYLRDLYMEQVSSGIFIWSRLPQGPPARGRQVTSGNVIRSRLPQGFFFFFKIYFYYFFHWKGGYTERRDREEDLPSDDSLPK